MTATTVTGTVARRQKADQLVSWLRGQQDELAMAAASHIKPSTLVRVTQGALRKDDKLMQAAIANPLSLLNCLLDAARLGHEPGTDQYYLVPFGSEVTGIEGYKGIIERMYRAGGVSSVVAQTVRQRDRYASRGENAPPVHEYDEFASPDQRGPLRGAYAYAIFGSGHCSQVIRMGRAEIMEHKAASRGADRADSPWQRWEPAMWKKTVLRALEPYVPTSSEWLNARAQAAAQAAQPHPNGLTPPLVPSEPIVDAEIVQETSGPAVQDSPVERADPAAGPETHRDPRAGKTALARLDGLLRRLPLGPPEDVASLLEWQCGGPYTASRSQVDHVTSFLEGCLDGAQGDVDGAAEAAWQRYRAATAQGAAEARDAGGGGHDG